MGLWKWAKLAKLAPLPCARANARPIGRRDGQAMRAATSSGQEMGRASEEAGWGSGAAPQSEWGPHCFAHSRQLSAGLAPLGGRCTAAGLLVFGLHTRRQTHATRLGPNAPKGAPSSPLFSHPSPRNHN